MLCDLPIHYISAGSKQLLQSSRVTSGLQTAHLAHLRCNLRLQTGERYLLLGRNGVGKSTLLRAIAGNHLEGWPHELKTFLVDQNSTSDLDSTPLQAVLAADSSMHHLQQEKETLEQQCEEGADDAEAISRRLCEIYDLLGDDEGVQEGRAQKILKGLGFEPAEIDKPVRNFSGGWRMRVALASALFMAPDLLLLDEPTNHLDFDTIDWLHTYLVEEYAGTVLCVSHDRAFINDVATQIIIFENNHLEYFHGVLDNLDIKAIATQKSQQRQVAALDRKKTHISASLAAAEQAAERRDAKRATNRDNSKYGPWHLAGRTAGGQKSSQVSSRLKKLNRMGLEKTLDGKKYKAQAEEGPRIGAANNNDGGWVDGKMTAMSLLNSEESSIKFMFPAIVPLGLPEGMSVIELRCVGHAYNGSGLPVLENIDLPIPEGCRIAVTGRNGAGKSTLLDIIAGELEITQGEVVRQRGLKIAYLRQHDVDKMQTCGTTPVEYVRERFPRMNDDEVSDQLNYFDVTEDMAARPMSSLSGGQCMRVALARLNAEEPHLLVLDEPTNHLDIQSIDALISALKDFSGGVIFSTHNRHFLDELAEEVVVVSCAGARMEKAELEPEAIRIAGLRRSNWREDPT